MTKMFSVAPSWFGFPSHIHCPSFCSWFQSEPSPCFVALTGARREGGLRASAVANFSDGGQGGAGAINTPDVTNYGPRVHGLNHILPMLKTFLFSPPGDV